MYIHMVISCLRSWTQLVVAKCSPWNLAYRITTIKTRYGCSSKIVISLSKPKTCLKSITHTPNFTITSVLYYQKTLTSIIWNELSKAISLLSQLLWRPTTRLALEQCQLNSKSTKLMIYESAISKTWW